MSILIANVYDLYIKFTHKLELAHPTHKVFNIPAPALFNDV